MKIELIEIGANGFPEKEVSLPEIAVSVGEANAALYQKTGFIRPWIGYFAVRENEVVGTCAFKSPPLRNRVEIAYFTFPGHEGQGIATEMARKLISIALNAHQDIDITAQTLPEFNASTAILKKLNFVQIGMAHDDDVGEVWEWMRSRSHTA